MRPTAAVIVATCGRDLSQRIYSTRGQAQLTAQKLLEARTQIEKDGFAGGTKVVGAFVTFEEQPAKRAALDLYGGGLSYILQRSDLRYGGTRRLRGACRAS